MLESDEVRRVITPTPTYSEAERDLFYRALAFTGQKLVAHGVTVVFDATASRRVYRDFAKSVIPRFIEIAVECPLATCMERDRKGTYRKGQLGESLTVPGLQSPYEAPINPDLRIDTHHHSLRRRGTPDLATWSKRNSSSRMLKNHFDPTEFRWYVRLRQVWSVRFIWFVWFVWLI